VTFFSYRGGVGRSTALVNVAVDLVLRGRRVLVVDFDLNAPDLAHFDLLRPNRPCQGVMEFIDDFIHRQRAPQVEEYVYQVSSLGTGRGALHVMPAGREDEHYAIACARVDWQDLYAIREGFLFFEDLKRQWRDILQVDYVLIDAQAGLGPTTATCTRQLADAVVTLFVPDGSAPAGYHRALREIVDLDEMGFPRIEFHQVASKVPDLAPEAVHGPDLLPFLEPGDPDLGMFVTLPAAVIPASPALFTKRQVVVESRYPRSRRSRLEQEYHNLANVLIRSNCTQDPDGARAFLRVQQQNPFWVIDTLDEEEPRWDLYSVPRLLEQIIKRFWETDAGILAQAASCLFLAGSYNQALEVLDQAVELSDNDSVLLWQRASYRQKVKHPGAASDLLALLDSRTPERLANTGLVELRRVNQALQAELDSLIRFTSPRDSDWLYNPVELDTRPLDTAEPLAEYLPGLDLFVVSAIRQLRRLEPGRIEEALQKPCVQCLSEDQKRLVLEPVPADLLSPPSHLEQNPLYLIGRQRWSEAIRLLELQPEKPFGFQLAMAYWGAGKEDQATDLCRSILAGLFPEGLPIRSLLEISGIDPSFVQILFLICFRKGDRELAKEFLDLQEELAFAHEENHIFSYWRYRTVSLVQFKADCDDQRQMLHGAAISPPFLGRAV
jgi:MinD-like ATPase involved in chromosome partitioning or flagellar assembly/tetratricopeptide (TPR) repeat protein